MEIFGFLCMLISGAMGLAMLVLWVWMLIDCLTKEPSEGNDKLIWALVILFANGIGALIYYLVRRPARIEKFGQ